MASAVILTTKVPHLPRGGIQPVLQGPHQRIRLRHREDAQHGELSLHTKQPQRRQVGKQEVPARGNAGVEVH